VGSAKDALVIGGCHVIVPSSGRVGSGVAIEGPLSVLGGSASGGCRGPRLGAGDADPYGQ